MGLAQSITECYEQIFDFQVLGSRRVEVDFRGGPLSSDGGCLLPREVDHTVGLGEKLAKCFTDFRDQGFAKHRLPVMLRQRILGIALVGTRLASATVGTSRLHLMKIAAQVTVSERRVEVLLCSSSPVRDIFAQTHHKLRAASG